MNVLVSHFFSATRWTLLTTSFVAAVASNAVTIPSAPLSVQTTATPMIMLAMGKDHRLFYEAYNDASDLNGDGTLDIRFQPTTIEYAGLFNPRVCYTHNNKNDGTGLFSPSSNSIGATKTNPGYCQGKWSGNFLNYVTTSRMDALKVVLYGGTREIDTATETILRRTYIPQDAHSWAKEYTSPAVDKYKISEYTPLQEPSSGKRHFFGSLTPNSPVKNGGTDCATLNNCSENLMNPWLSVVENSGHRVWNWASTERPVLEDANIGTADDIKNKTVKRTNYTVRVEACKGVATAGCKQYGTASNATLKPVGLLHDFGDNDSAYFGMLSGSYDKNYSGGRLRKVASSFKEEVNVNGTFTANATIVQTINKLRIRDFQNGNNNGLYRSGSTQAGSKKPAEGLYVDWGNPLGEILYESMRYFAGKSAATTDFMGATTADTAVDTAVGLPQATWDNPYDTVNSKAKAPWCARANVLAISDTNVSYDSDQLPGSYFNTGFTGTLNGVNITTTAKITTNTTSLNVADIANLITNKEGITGKKFIGRSTNADDNAPTAKDFQSLASVRGLAPEEPTKEGSYYAASVAHYAKVNDLQPNLKGNQTVDSFMVALASPLPRIEVKLPNKNVMTLVPFAKSVGGAFGLTSTVGSFQPTNQIVDFYVESIDNDNPNFINKQINGGRYQAKFRINFEDVEQGNDHDMDAILEYTVKANADSTLDVTVTPTYQAGGAKHRFGYIMSGSTNDGIYLVVQDENDTIPYFLNVPPTRLPGYCNKTNMPADCSRLPFLGATAATVPNTATSNIRFYPGANTAASFLKDPMWYAAKYGGFTDDSSNPTALPDKGFKWDSDGDGVPDNYFFVQNPLNLRDSLRKAFNAIIGRKSSFSNIATNSSRLESTSQVYLVDFETGKWAGDIKSYPITKTGIGTQPLWSARKSLPAWNNRNIYMATGAGAFVNTKNTAFTALPASVQTNLSNTAAIYDYIRGDASNEIAKGGAFRSRETPLGDIIHSSPNLDPDNGTFYVGGNDGMLHAFNNVMGTETFAFIPGQNQSKLKNLTSLNYEANHNYFVDGDVALGFKTEATNNTKHIYSLLGRGGKGLFSLIATGGAPNLRWEYTPEGSTSPNPTDSATDKDLGLMIGRPVFAMMNNNKAALLVGNGYNSTDGKAVLYIFILNKDGSLSEVKKLDTGVGGDNGLAGPAFIDTNGDGKADAIFGGDLKGNLWKFDVSNPDAGQWNVAYTKKPLFKAINDAGDLQPITAPLFIAKNSVANTPNNGSYYIFFGTGSYFQTGDAADKKVQSWYGITDGTAEITARTDLAKRTVAVSGVVSGTNTAGNLTSTEVRVFSPATNGDMTGKRGWYLDLADGKYAGERIITRSQILATIKPALLVTSLFPLAGDPCAPGGDGFINFIDPFTGGGIQLDLLDTDRNGKFNASDRLTDGAGNQQFASSIKANVGIPTTPIFIPSGSSGTGGGDPNDATVTQDNPLGLIKTEKKRYCDGNGCEVTGKEKDCLDSGIVATNGTDGSTAIGVGCLKGGSLKGRISWREILKD